MPKSVFISSTSVDLKDHRAAVDAATRRLKQRPINMQDFGAQPGGAVGVSLREVGDADVFVGILAAQVTADLTKLLDKRQRQTLLTRVLAAVVVAALFFLMIIVNPNLSSNIHSIIPAQPAKTPFPEDEVGIVLTDLQPIGANAPDNVISNLASDLQRGGIPYIWVRQTLTSDEQARALAAQHNATIVLWGEADVSTIRLFFEISAPENVNVASPSDAAQANSSTLESFELLISTGLNDLGLFLYDAVRGQILYLADSYAEAEAAFDAALGRLPVGLETEFSVSGLYFARGTIRQQRSALDDAIADYSSAIEINSQFATAYNNRGLAYYDQGKLDDAIADYNSATEIDPQYAAAYNNRGIAYYDQGKLDDAIADCTRAIEINPQLADPYYNRGRAYYDQGKLDDAIADYNSAIAIDPQYAAAYNNRGNVYRRQGKLEEAVADYNSAIAIDPQYAAAYNNRGLVYGNQEKLGDAIADFDRALEIDPQYATAYYNRGIAYFVQGKLAEAIADYSSAIEINPQLADVYWGRGLAHYAIGNYPAAIEDYRTYERLTGQLEPFMVEQIAEMEAALTATPTPG